MTINTPESFFESPKMPKEIQMKTFDLESFLKENQIDANNPEIQGKITVLQQSLKNRKDITKNQLLDLLAFHDIFYAYTSEKRKYVIHADKKPISQDENI